MKNTANPERCSVAVGSAGWVPIATPPAVEVPVALHFEWGEVRDGWLMRSGLYRTASMPLPQDTATITHWCALPNVADQPRPTNGEPKP